MPVKRRRLPRKNRRQNESKPSSIEVVYPQILYETHLEKCNSDLQTIPDQTFGKIYSTQIIEEISSSNASSTIEPNPIERSPRKPRKKKVKTRKRV
ncbi:hypothetical protein I4U23_012622 [Adineta vaga]|nr:hypothetical protein I4U23_012622 [Adineta vaga]